MTDVRTEAAASGEPGEPASEPTDEVEAATTGDTGGRSTLDWLFLGSILAALLPIVVATVRAARSGWLPIGDNAYFAVRAQDVFTEHHPWLGTWTSASLNTDTNFNNPGPLLFDLFAIPAKLTDGGIGVAIGSALLNSLAVIGIALVARRRGGPVLGVLAMAIAAILCWTMGSEMLFDPWQPHSLLLTFLLGVLLAWSLAEGDLTALPWAVFIASLILQTHLSYAVLMAFLAAWGVGAMLLSIRRSWRDDPDARPALRRRLVKIGAITALVAVVCWGQPLWEQFTGEPGGNIGRLASNMTASEKTFGQELGTRAAADVLVVPPFWFRPSFEEAFLPDPAVPPGADQYTTITPSFPVAAVLIALLMLAVAAAALDARRRGDRVASTALGTALVSLAAAVFTSWNLPMGVLGVPPHQLRWLWPIAAFTTFALLVYVIRRVDLSERPAQRMTMVIAGLTAVVALANLVPLNVNAGPSVDNYAIDVMKKVKPQMAALEGEGTILLDMTGIRFAEPYTGPVMAEMQRRDIPFVVEDEGMVRQLGDKRRLSGDAQRLLFREGDRAFETPEGARRVVLVEGLEPDEKAELDDLRTEIQDHLDENGIALTDLGREVLQRDEHGIVRAAVEKGDAGSFVKYGGLLFTARHDLLDLGPEWDERLERFVDLQGRWNARTLGLFLAPLEKPA